MGETEGGAQATTRRCKLKVCGAVPSTRPLGRGMGETEGGAQATTSGEDSRGADPADAYLRRRVSGGAGEGPKCYGIFAYHLTLCAEIAVRISVAGVSAPRHSALHCLRIGARPRLCSAILTARTLSLVSCCFR